MSLKYRADIDALRAIAVLIVVFCHMEFSLFSGGFVGVSVFFVISGYLLTGIIKRNLENNTFSFLNFYENRIRRIVPALVFVCLCTMLAFWFTYVSNAEMSELQSSIKRVLLAIPNFFFYSNTGYFDPVAETMPMLHTWSLGVEEQFYFLFPLFMWICYKYTANKLLFLTISITLLSLCLSIFLVFYNQEFTFYMLPTRAWEIFMGGVLAMTQWSPKKQSMKRMCVYIGLLLILIPTFSYNKFIFYPFPGLMALAPCLGAAFYLSGGINLHEKSYLLKLLEVKPFVFIGLISYSLYLWHWPILVFYKYPFIDELTFNAAVILTLLTIVFAAASWKFIESPIRKKAIFRKRKVLYPLTLLTIGACLILTFEVRSTFFPLEHKYIVQTKAIKHGPVFGAAEKLKKDFVLVGDSHAGMFQDSFARLAHSYNVTGQVFSVLPQNTYSNDTDARESNIEQGWNDFTKSIKEFSPQTVFWSSRWTRKISGNIVRGVPDNKELLYKNGDIELTHAEALYAGLRDSIHTLHALGVKNIYFILPIPEPKTHVPQGAAKLAIYYNWEARKINETIGEKHTQYQERTRDALDVFERLAKEFPTVHFLDACPLLLDETKTYYNVVDAEAAFYVDDDHFSAQGASLVDSIFEPAFQELSRTKNTDNPQSQ